ncbi:MAG: hypothetical protein WC607_00045 [Candidatus Micrarchaeia archaeon]
MVKRNTKAVKGDGLKLACFLGVALFAASYAASLAASLLGANAFAALVVIAFASLAAGWWFARVFNGETAVRLLGCVSIAFIASAMDSLLVAPVFAEGYLGAVVFGTIIKSVFLASGALLGAGRG